MNGIQGSKRLGCAPSVIARIGTKNERDDYYVYIWLDPRKPGEYIYNNYSFGYEPIYVGKGRGSRSSNFRARSSFLKRKLLKIGTPLIQHIGNLLEKEAYNLEMELIELIGRRTLKKGPLCNLTEGGGHPSGWALPEDRKVKISKGVRVNWEKRREHPYKKGWHNSEEFCRAISQRQTGSKWPEERKRKLSLTNKGRKRPPFSEEWKKNISLGSKKRKPISEETRKKLSLASLGKKKSDEMRKKMSEIAKNRSEETRLKISKNMKRYWAHRRQDKDKEAA